MDKEDGSRKTAGIRASQALKEIRDKGIIDAILEAEGITIQTIGSVIRDSINAVTVEKKYIDGVHYDLFAKPDYAARMRAATLVAEMLGLTAKWNNLNVAINNDGKMTFAELFKSAQEELGTNEVEDANIIADDDDSNDKPETPRRPLPPDRRNGKLGTDSP